MTSHRFHIARLAVTRIGAAARVSTMAVALVTAGDSGNRRLRELRSNRNDRIDHRH